MRILITGSPGTGKSKLAKWLGKKLKHKVIDEKEFAVAHGLGKFDDDEFVIPMKKLQAALKKELKERKKVILEGHTLCEIKLPVDLCIVLEVDPELLEERLKQRNYSELKIQDNVFCEGIEYCKKHAKRNYRKVEIVKNEKTFKELQSKILVILREKGLK